MDLISKFKLAIQLELDHTLIELVYDAEQRGQRIVNVSRRLLNFYTIN